MANAKRQLACCARALGVCGLLAAALGAGSVRAQPLVAVSPHHQGVLDHPPAESDNLPLRSVGSAFLSSPDQLRFSTRAPRGISGTVYGYVPYWVSEQTVLNWDLLTHVSYFSLAMTPAGTLDATAAKRLASARYKKLRDDARTAGVVFTVTVTNFTGSEIAQIVGANKQAALDTLSQLLATSGAQGINIDFEFVPKASASAFRDFMRELSQRAHNEVPGSHVTFASPQGSNGGAYLYTDLLADTDGAMIMFYGCHWSGSTYAGPLAPLTAGAIWSSTCTAQKTITDFLGWAGGHPEKIILGLPFYGNRWATEGATAPSKATSRGSSEIYTKCKARFAVDRRWDSDSQTPFSTYVENGTRYQTWCDDAESLDAKLAYMVSRGVRGMGIWALGYDGENSELWAPIAARLAPPTASNLPPNADAGAAQTAPLGQTITLNGQLSADPEGQPLTYAWRQISGPAVSLAASTAVTTTFVPPEAGTYRFWLTVSDGALDSLPAETQVLVGDVAEPEDGGTDEAQPLNHPLDATTSGQQRGCQQTGPAPLLLATACVFLLRLRKKHRSRI